MPQLGETVTEGTITKWYKAVGDQVARDEPLFEVSTDKVDSEVPSPAEGVLTAILVPEGDTVDVGVTLAVIGDEVSTNGRGSAPAAASAEPAAPARPRRAAAVDRGGRGRRRPAAGVRAHRRPVPGTDSRGPAGPVTEPLGRRAGALAGGAQAAQRARPRPGRRPRYRTRGPDHPERCRVGHRRPTADGLVRPGAGAEHHRPPPAGHRPSRREPGGRMRPATRSSRSPTSGGGPPSTWSGPRPRRPTP